MLPAAWLMTASAAPQSSQFLCSDTEQARRKLKTVLSKTSLEVYP